MVSTQRRHLIWALGVALVTSVSFQATALADGCHIPPLVYKVPATIPQQRALISFRNGHETLIIESSYRTEAKDVGWIIPLPAVPDSILPVSSGAMKTISFRLQPEITHELPEWLLAMCVLAGVVLFYSYFMVVPFGANKFLEFLEGAVILVAVVFVGLPLLLMLAACVGDGSLMSWVFCLLIACVLGGLTFLYFYFASVPSRANKFLRFLEATGLLLALFLGFSMFATAGVTAGPGLSLPSRGISVEKQVQAGSYEVAILKATNVEGLNAWLADNGFMSMPEKAAVVVREYIAKGWCFSAAKLTRTEGGTSTPHPIRFDFVAKEAVYPMRLTAFAGAPVDLEIFVVGAGEAVCAPLQREFCDTYALGTKSVRIMGLTEDSHRTGSQIVATGSSFRQSVGHPDLTAVMWEGCVMTKLSGNVAPQQMDKDFLLSWKAASPYRKHYYSARGAKVVTCGWLFVICALSCAGWLFAARRVVRRCGVKGCIVRAAVTGVVAMVACAAIYVLLPKADVSILHWRMGRYFDGGALDAVKKLNIPGDAPAYRITAAMQQATGADSHESTKNIFVGGTIMQEISPGNWILRQQEGMWYIVTYDEWCQETWHQVSSSPQ